MQISDKLTNKATLQLIEALRDRVEARGGGNQPVDTGFLSKFDMIMGGRAEPTVIVGPIVGKVTYDQAVIMLEVDEDAELECIATPKKGRSISCRAKFPAREARCFVFQGLTPNTMYKYAIKGINSAQEHENEGNSGWFRFKTFPLPGNVKKLRVVAISCDRPRRLMPNQENPWEALRDDAKNINLFLHLGDQVYTKMDGFLERAVIASDLFGRPGGDAILL